ncbi:hypothetical protein TRFO_13231 [Tritrichomonas foetus]|uniref:Uncharacterized protein n=1 Tax=Tritrichomonas foetus TaxID=1144522 RepID=A0A1J4L327_9EUKA|nr:hypothetical protein TRFO_13231 [Tritrichomonas foetus]|eukprot:OHT16380.1 hypothetical protein TRFO_13231 [Tritrichomonas foetus]
MFSPKYHGTTFDVIYGTTEAQLRDNNRYHLVTSLDRFDLISDDWKEKTMTFYPSDIDGNSFKKSKTWLSVYTKSNGTIYLDARPNPSDKLCEALTPILNIPNPEIRFLALPCILPSFNFSDQRGTMMLHKCIMEQSSQILTSFHAQLENVNTRNISGAFVDLYSCAYRMRYNDNSAHDSANTTQKFSLDIKRYMIKIWCEAVLRAGQSLTSNDQTNDPLYYIIIIASAVDTISTASEGLNLNLSSLLAASQNLKQTQQPNDVKPVLAAVAQLLREVENALDQGYLADPPFDKANLISILNMVIIALSGFIVGIYQYDLDRIAERVVEYTRAIVNQANAEDARKLMNSERQTFLTELLRFLDGGRYDNTFQYVYCVWDLEAGQ